ncbi:MAG: hypothetical protein KAV00_13530 [Phycisphaerae bacterium]|nr:hypothetical protein [Phycisphaerae bacterium]
MRCVELSGTDFEIGLQQGEALRDAIGDLFEKFSIPGGRLWLDLGWTKQELEKAKQGMLSLIGKYAPGVMDEIKGIAEGARLPLDEVTLWNFISDIHAFNKNVEKPKEDCSVVILPQSQNGPILGQNCDLPEEEGNPQFLKKVSPNGKPSFLCTAWIGTYWVHNFLNSHGLTTGGVSGSKPKHVPDEGIPAKAIGWFLARNCRRTEDAIDYYLNNDFLGLIGGNSCFLDKNGQGVVIDRLSKRRPQDFRKSNKSPLFAPSGFDSPEMKEAVYPDPEPESSVHKARKENIANLLEHVPRSIEGVKSILRNHAAAGAVCRHDKNDVGDSNTTYSIIILPEEGRILFAGGPPCRNEYEEYRI